MKVRTGLHSSPATSVTPESSSEGVSWESDQGMSNVTLNPKGGHHDPAHHSSPDVDMRDDDRSFAIASPQRRRNHHFDQDSNDGSLSDGHIAAIGHARVANAPSDDSRKARLAASPHHELPRSPQSSTLSNNIHNNKRSASSSPSREPQQSTIGRGSAVPKSYVHARGRIVPVSTARRKPHVRTTSSLAARSGHLRTQSAGVPVSSYLSNTSPKLQSTAAFAPNLDKLRLRQDSGYASRQSTLNQASWNPDVRAPAYAAPHHIDAYGFGLLKQQGLTGLPRPKYDMVLQPKSSPLTQEQLGAEVKGIYAGLVMVEAKCINLDNARAADPNAEVSKADWQTLIALHSTLLAEHHDFLMATQHPSANPALRGLASKYCMPARMWKHGIHAFLEVLRHRRPQSQEYMLVFIYAAYEMMGLLFETIPSYLDTWIECLGDLARYRMAIEEDKEIHAVWSSVAARWYQMAADRHPQIGRLYHHLGILERPSLRKFYFYARSLTSVVPFVNAAESLGTLCAPILQDDKAIRCGSHSAEAMTICFHARVFTTQSTDGETSSTLIAQDGVDALNLLKEQPSGKIASYGVALAVTNIAGLFQYGLQENVFRTMYAEALAREAHNARPSVQDPDSLSNAAKAMHASVQVETNPMDAVVTFWASCFNTLIERELDQATLRDLMQYVHVNLVWFSSLINLRARLKNPAHVQVVNDLFDKIQWAKLATFLNAISQIDPITQRVEEHAVHNIFLMPDRPTERRPLVEDYMLRGICWSDNYPAVEIFYGIEDDDGSRLLETPARLHLRAERVLWLACLVAQPAKESGLKYDRSTQRFAARQLGCRTAVIGIEHAKAGTKVEEMRSMSPKSMDVLQNSSPSSTADGYDIVSVPDVRSMSSMDESRISTPMKSYVSAKTTAGIRGSPEREQLVAKRKVGDTEIKIEGGGEVF